MARSRRGRSVPRGTRRRRKGDWVYRGNQYPGFTGGAADPSVQASYTESVTSVLSGLANSRGLILYDSWNRMQHVMTAGAGVPNLISNAARVDGSKPCIMATEAWLAFIPDTWALGTVFTMGWRLGVFLQDPISGAVQVPASYSMWVDNSLADNASVWANDRQWVREGRTCRDFNNTQTAGIQTLSIRWRGRRYLRPDECWALYLEVPGTTQFAGVSSRMMPWCRSFVSDGNS